MEAISLPRHLMEKYRDTYKDLHLVFIDLKKHTIWFLKRLCTYVVDFGK